MLASKQIFFGGKHLTGQCFPLLDFIILELKSWKLVCHTQSELTNTELLVSEIPGYLIFM